MIRLVLAPTTDGQVTYVVVDEVTGRHIEHTTRLPITPSVEEEILSELEILMTDEILADLDKAPVRFTGLRGTTVLASSQLPDGKLQLRSGADVMTFDHELALCAKKALTWYLSGTDSDQS